MPHRQPKEQYHHFIPRFVLRRFQISIEGQTALNKKERKKVFRKTGVQPEFVNFFSLAAGTLEQRAISTVYGVNDLYKDVNHVENVQKLEEDLGKLECKAALVIANLHDSLPSGTFRVKRRDLNQLRKFLFIMHYRGPRLASTYFSEEHPGNAMSVKWIMQYRKIHGLESSADMWLHVLRYYLDTSHHQLLLDAEETMKKHGGLLQYHAKLHKPGVDPDDKFFHAVAYDKQANTSYFGVWQAADDEEFVLGNNSFGLWEGRLGGEPEVHRLFLLSPKALVVLRTNFLRPDILQQNVIPPEIRRMVDSDLFDIAMATPDVQYHDARAIPREMLNQYRASKKALSDVFTFKITKLRPAQTFAVNRVLMINVDPTGSLTFTSKELMLKTLNTYTLDPTSTFEGPPGYHLLRKQLEVVDVLLFGIVIDIISGMTTYSSRFERAYAVLMHYNEQSSLDNKFSEDFRIFSSLLLGRLAVAPPGLSQPPFRTHAESGVLLQQIPNDTFERIFRCVLNCGAAATDNLGRASNPLSRLRDDVVVVGFVDWTARWQPDVYQTLLDGSHPAFKFDETEPKTTAAANQPRSLLQDTENESLGDVLQAYVHNAIHKMEFRSNYDRAFAIHQRATASETMMNPFSTEIRRIVPLLTGRFISLLRPSLNPIRLAPMTLVSSCSVHDSRNFFALMSNFAEKIVGFERPSGESSVTETVFHEVILVGLASTLAKERPEAIGFFFQEMSLQHMFVPQDQSRTFR